jgi:cytochrome P450
MRACAGRGLTSRSTVQEYNPWDPQVRRDPYPIYRRLRENGPVAFDARAGLWFVSGYDACAAALRDHRMSAQLGQRLRRRDEALPPSMLSADGAEHTRLRGSVQHFFSNESVRELRPRVQALVDWLLDELAEREEFDATADLVRPLSAMVLADLVGIPGDDFGRFHGWARDASANLDPLAPPDLHGSATAAADELAAYLRALLERRRTSPGPGLAGALGRASALDCPLGTDERATVVSLVVIGGYEPLADLLGNGLLNLLSRRDVWARLAVEPELVPACVEELLRFDPPIQLVARVTTADVAVGDVEVAAGEGVVGLLGAANRDPARFGDPDRLRPDRHPNPHLAFGAGPHFCLGASLARLVGHVALATLAARLPMLELAEADVHWRESLVPRGLRRLPVRCLGLHGRRGNDR